MADEGSAGSDLGEDERGIDDNLSKREITASSFVNNLTSPRIDHEVLINMDRTIPQPDSLEDEPEVPSELNSRIDQVANNFVELSCCSGRSHLD